MPNTINTKNIFRKRKQFMRLCAIAMVEDSIIKPIESVVLDQIYDKIFDGCDDGAFIAELGDKYQNIKSSSPAMLYGALLTSDESMRRSMFMNIDAMNLEEVEAELKYIIQVITADDSVTDREREAFRVVCKLFKIKDPVAIGTAIGTSSHAGGTAKALQLGQTEGAISGLSIAVAGIMTVVVAPLFMNLFK